VQNSTLFDAGYLAKLEYYSFDVIDRSKLELNSSGTDFTPASLSRYYKSIDMPSRIVSM
jgi:DNA repair protein RadD